MNNTELLAYWITEREAMRIRKELPALRDEKYEYGWSNDPFMGLVRYCNVRREDDKVTRWLAQHWRPDHHAVWKIVLARMVNYIPSLAAMIQYPLDPDTAAVILKNRRMVGEKIWTSAYTISTAGASMDKIDYVIAVVKSVRDVWGDCGDFRNSDNHQPTLAEAHRALTSINGLGSFLAAQVVADLKNTTGHILQRAPDWYSWSAHGPGSLRGLSAYFGRPVTPRGYNAALTRCWQEVKPLLPVQLHDLHMQDFQNCMCEFSKFVRVRNGGHARNKYTAR